MSSLFGEKKLYHRVKILSEAFLLSSRALDYKSVLRTATKHFKAFTEADASVLLVNDNVGNLIPVFSLGIPVSKIKDVNLSLSTRLKDILTRPVLDVRYTAFMNIPLIYNRKLVGLVAVFSIVPEKFHTFEHDRYENLFLTMLASYIAVSIEGAILADTIKSIECSQVDWENIFDAIDDLVSVHNTEHTIIRANRAVARSVSMDIRDIVGKKCCEVFHGTDVPLNTYPCCKVEEMKTTYTEDIKYPRIRGAFNVTTFPLFSELGKFTGIVQVAKDVTGQKKMQN